MTLFLFLAVAAVGFYCGWRGRQAYDHEQMRYVFDCPECSFLLRASDPDLMRRAAETHTQIHVSAP